MSTMANTRRNRSRWSFSEEFKASAVRLVLEEGQTVAAAARDLDLTESSLRNWVEQARADRGRGEAGGPDDRRARNSPGCAKRIASCKTSAKS